MNVYLWYSLQNNCLIYPSRDGRGTLFLNLRTSLIISVGLSNPILILLLRIEWKRKLSPWIMASW